MLDKMKYSNLFLVVVLMCTTIFAHAQSGKTVQGMLRDSALRVVAGASVQLLSPQDSLGTSSSVGGFYTFNNVKGDSFRIKISSLGFEPFEQVYEFPKGENSMMLPTIVLTGLPNMLEEVVVDGVITVQVKGDTVEYSTRDLKLRDGSVAEDALKRLQGVEVDKDGNVTAQGESVTRVRINGKDFFGGDVKTATQNLPANIIEKIQVVDDYGDMANLTGNRTGDSEKVLNIQIDPKYNSGWMTTLRVGGGTEERYQATGMWMGLTDKSQVSILGNLNNMNAQLFDFQTVGGGARRGRGPGGGGGWSPNGLTNTGSIGVNIRHDFSERLKVYGSYSYGRDDNDVFSSTNRLYTFETGDQTETGDNISNTIRANHRFESNIEWNITDRDYLKLTPQFGVDDNTGNSLDSSAYYLDNLLDNRSIQRTLTNSQAPRYALSGLYNRKLSDHGRNFFINFNYNNATTESDYRRELDRQLADPNNANAELTEVYELTYQNVNNKNWNAGASLSYTEPVGEKGRIEVTYDMNVTDYDNNNNQRAEHKDGSVNTKPELNFDYDYDYAFSSHRIGTSYTFNNDKLRYTLGASVQPTLLKGSAFSQSESAVIDRKNFNVVPIASFEYKFSRQSNLTANYSGRASEPGVNQVLPFEVSTSRTSTTIGNPDLDPEFTHGMRIRFRSGDFQKGKTFFAMLRGDLTKDKIVSSVKRYRDESADPLDRVGLVQETRYLNETGENVYDIGSFYHLGRSFRQNTLSFMWGGGVSFNKGVSYVTEDPNVAIGDKNLQSRFNVQQFLGFRYLPSENLEINPGLRFNYGRTENSLDNRVQNITGWTPTLIGSVNITPTTIFGADVSKTFNSGYGDLNVNPFIINTYIEQRFLKGQRGTLRLQAFDLLNEQTNISRTVGDNYIFDSQTNRLARYIMMTFTFKLQKFALGAPQEENNFPGGMRRPRM